jgi:hypothetical protein
MRYDHLYAKHQKRISPPFRKSKRGFDDWVRSLRSVDQHPYDMSEIQCLQQVMDQKKKTALRQAGSRRRSITASDARRVGDDEGRWQDDGGRSRGEPLQFNA